LQAGAGVARGGVFVLRAGLVSGETRALLLSMARAVLLGGRGTLSEQLNRLQEAETTAAPPPRRVPPAAVPQTVAVPPNLEFFNGFGGFAADGREYVTLLGGGRWLPVPWINVIANPSF